MSAGVWRYDAQGSARAMLRNGSGKITSGSTIPLQKIARTPDMVRTPVWSSSQNAEHATRNRIAKLVTTARTRLTRKARPATGPSGSAMWNSSSPNTVGPTPRARKWYVAPDVAGEVPPDQAHRPVQVDGHVAGADPLGEVVGGAAAPDRDGHQQRLADPDVGDRVGGVVPAVRVLPPHRQVGVAEDHAED